MNSIQLFAEPVSPVDDAINSWFDPIATWFGDVIFFPNTIGEISFPIVVLWLIFAALASALSGTVGLGDIAGVGVAIALGGPSATFWMIIAGLLGMCTKFVECTLGVKCREIDENGVVHGGPFTYLPVAFRRFSKPAAASLTGLFAIAILIFGVVGGGMFQADRTFALVCTATGGDDGLLAGPFASLAFRIGFAALVALAGTLNDPETRDAVPVGDPA